MRLRMLVQMVGPGVNREENSIVEIDEPEAGRLVAAGYAEPVTDERATAKAAPRKAAAR